MNSGETTELGDIAIALHNVQQAPTPSKTTTTITTKRPKAPVRYTSTPVSLQRTTSK